MISRLRCPPVAVQGHVHGCTRLGHTRAADPEPGPAMSGATGRCRLWIFPVEASEYGTKVA